jgi:hypothetical protein
MKTSDELDVLRRFRLSLYGCFDRGTDALFDLTDAVLTAGVVPSPVHLSLQGVHRRGWGSLYAALSRGRVDEEALRQLVVRHPLQEEDRTAVYGVEMSVWPDATRRAAPSAVTTTIPPDTQPGSPSSPSLGLPVDRTAWLRARWVDCSYGPRACSSDRER